MPSSKKFKSVERKTADDQLFFVDKVPTAAQRKFGKPTIAPGSAAIQTSRTALAQSRVLGIEKVLQLNEQIQPFKKIVPVKRKDPSEKRNARKLKARADAMTDDEQPAAKRAKKAGSYDLWSTAVTTRVLKPKGRGYETTKAKLIKKIPAVLPPLAGESVNPNFDDYVDLAASVAQQYEDDERAQHAKEQALSVGRKMHPQQVFGQKVEVVVGLDSDEEADDDDNDDAVNNDDDGDNNDEEEEEEEEGKRVVMRTKKSADRADDEHELDADGRNLAMARRKGANPIKRRERMRAKHASVQAKLIKKQQADALELGAIVADQRKHARQQRVDAGKRTVRRRELAMRTGGIGRNKFEEADIPVPVPSRVVESRGRLRNVASAGGNARLAIVSLQRRGIIDVEGKRTKKEYKRVYSTIHKK